MKNIHVLSFLLMFLLGGILSSCSDKKMEEKLAATEARLAELEAELASSPETEPKFIHTVLFWLEEGATEEAKQDFLEDLRGFEKISSVRRFYLGHPAGTPREVVDNTYDIALIIHFDDMEGQEAYQVDPIHTAMVESHNGVWRRVQVYDTQL